MITTVAAVVAAVVAKAGVANEDNKIPASKNYQGRKDKDHPGKKAPNRKPAFGFGRCRSADSTWKPRWQKPNC